LAEEKKLLVELTEKVTQRASQGATWETVIGNWEMAMRDHPELYRYERTTIIDHVSCLRRWTEAWLKKPAAVLNKGDARDVLIQLNAAGKTRGFQKKVKHTVNVVYNWGIEQRLIRGVNQSPMRGIQLLGSKTEKVPDILTLEEIRKLLQTAKDLEHRWYPIWAMALLTGMRNGELYALLWTDVDFDNHRITVSKSYHSRTKSVKSTKSGSWRTVPISEDLKALLLEVKAQAGDRPHVLPRFGPWSAGMQAEVLRAFCEGIGVRPIRFHALRACFATQLLSHDIAPARIMKICGWTQLKTMQHYVRMAGIDEKGATDQLRILPSDMAVMGEVVNLFQFKGKKPQ
jgi:integrase